MSKSSSYAERLRDPRWQRKRLEIMERDGWACRDCGDKGSTLQVHHLYYVKGRDPWEYPSFSLVCLCDECHKERHDYSRETIDEDEHFQPMMEWELAIDNITDSGREELWDLGCEISIASELLKCSHKQVLEMVLSYLRDKTTPEPTSLA